MASHEVNYYFRVGRDGLVWDRLWWDVIAWDRMGSHRLGLLYEPARCWLNVGCTATDRFGSKQHGQ